MIPRLLKSSPKGPIVALFFCGDSFADQRRKLLDALPPVCTVLAADSDQSHDEAMRKLVLALDDTRPRWIVGYSAGGHRVRDVLDLVRTGDVVVTADATHGSLETRPQTMPLVPWLKLGERAEAGAVRWLSSHTYLTYVEALREPYYSTATVMRRASRTLLPEPETGFTRSDIGKLSIWSYQSGPADAPAHARQVREVLPMLLREVTRELTGCSPPPDLGDQRSPLERAAEKAWAKYGRQPTRGEMAYERALAWLELGVAEIAGPASHPMIAEALRRCVRGGKPVGLSSDETSWCAAAASSWCDWLTPRCAVHELVTDARAAGTWRDVAGYAPALGDLEIYSREGGDPRKGGLGHVAIVGTGAERIGGNEANAVRRRLATLPGQQVVGWVQS